MTPITGPVRVRFAPSPTGYLHVGGARTALFNWLFAKKYGGQFLLRVEDTDKARSTDESTRAIFEGLNWLGLHWDEEVVYQGKNAAEHEKAAYLLYATGAAYPCFCTPDEIAAERKAAEEAKQTYVYSGKCRNLSAVDVRDRLDQPHVLRFKVPESGETSWEDIIHGKISFPNKDLGGDFIILRSDGSPIYNLAVVCDDIDMGITHVLRGDDHVSNTPKQILLYQAFEAKVPQFGHMPMIFGNDGKKLSKRHGATAVGDYQHLGILPQAMLNFLALLGWSPGQDREVMSLHEITQAFSADAMSAKAAVFDMKKLEWMNGQHLQRLLTNDIIPYMGGADLPEMPMDWWEQAFTILKPRARTTMQLANLVKIYRTEKVDFDEKAVAKQWDDPDLGKAQLSIWKVIFEKATPWEEKTLDHEIRATGPDAEPMALRKLLSEGFAHATQTLRLALTGSLASPPLPDVLLLLGREKSLRRIDHAIEYLGRLVPMT